MRDTNHSFSGLDGNLKILSKSAGVPEPGEVASRVPRSCAKAVSPIHAT